MTQLVSTSSNAFTKSLHGKSLSGVGLKYTQELYRYQILYDSVISQMRQYTKYFSEGNYETLVTTFTPNVYKNLIVKASASVYNTTIVSNLVGFKYDPNKFTLMRKNSYDIIDGLNQTIKVVNKNLVYEQDILELSEYKKILETPKLLIEYIEKQKLNTMIFQASETFQTQIKLKPWFEKYLLLYGPPGNGVFKSELLAKIVIDLINSGVIKESDFINS
jgi:hypothetical protein